MANEMRLAETWPVPSFHHPVSATNLVGLALAILPVLRPFGLKYVGLSVPLRLSDGGLQPSIAPTAALLSQSQT